MGELFDGEWLRVWPAVLPLLMFRRSSSLTAARSIKSKVLGPNKMDEFIPWPSCGRGTLRQNETIDEQIVGGVEDSDQE